MLTAVLSDPFKATRSSSRKLLPKAAIFASTIASEMPATSVVCSIVCSTVVCSITGVVFSLVVASPGEETDVAVGASAVGAIENFVLNEFGFCVRAVCAGANHCASVPKIFGKNPALATKRAGRAIEGSVMGAGAASKKVETIRSAAARVCAEAETCAARSADRSMRYRTTWIASWPGR